ncbi:carboxypeptidase-like regulatory domain-containing protein [Lutibacter sp.]
MSKIYFFVILSFLLHINNLFSQTIDYKGQILDKESDVVLPFSTVEVFSLKKGVIANDSGKFSISIPANSINDTVEFSFLGYKRKKIVLNSLLDTEINIIKLEKETYVLKEVIINPKDFIQKKLGVVVKKSRRGWHLGNPGDQHAILIKNPFNKRGRLKNINFYITKNGFPTTPFRVRIYSYDRINNKPGKDLLNTNLIVSFNKKRKAWFTVDMEKYNIVFPKEGFFVAMEWIFTSDNYYYFTNMKMNSGNYEDVKCYGQTIGLTTKQKEVIYWRKYLGGKWYHMKYGNAMINADIEFSN